MARVPFSVSFGSRTTLTFPSGSWAEQHYLRVGPPKFHFRRRRGYQGCLISEWNIKTEGKSSLLGKEVEGVCHIGIKWDNSSNGGAAFCRTPQEDQSEETVYSISSFLMQTDKRLFPYWVFAPHSMLWQSSLFSPRPCFLTSWWCIHASPGVSPAFPAAFPNVLSGQVWREIAENPRWLPHGWESLYFPCSAYTTAIFPAPLHRDSPPQPPGNSGVFKSEIQYCFIIVYYYLLYMLQGPIYHALWISSFYQKGGGTFSFLVAERCLSIYSTALLKMKVRNSHKMTHRWL